MPAFVAALVGALITAAGSIAGRVLIALGIGFVSYAGLATGLGALKTQVMNTFTSMSGTPLIVLGLLKIDVCINILFSALTARLTLKGLTSGTLKRMVIK